MYLAAVLLSRVAAAADGAERIINHIFQVAPDGRS